MVDQDREHVYQPGLLFLPFGLAHGEDLIRPRHRQLKKGIDFVESDIDRVDVDGHRVFLTGGRALPYDVLVTATGARLVPEETDGLTGPGWMENVFTFYDLPGATGLEQALQAFEGGRIVVNVVDMPIKCPVAPLEFCFLADWYFHERGIRDRVQLTLVTPLDAAFTKPRAASMLGGMLEDKGVELVTTPAPSTWAAPRASATPSTSSRRIRTRCSRRWRRRSSPSATPRTSRRPRPVR